MSAKTRPVLPRLLQQQSAQQLDKQLLRPLHLHMATAATLTATPVPLQAPQAHLPPPILAAAAECLGYMLKVTSSSHKSGGVL